MDDELERFSSHINTSDYFIDRDGRGRPLVVEHSTGMPRYSIEADGTLSDFDPARNAEDNLGARVSNPPDFAGFPDHDRSDPAHGPEAHGLDPALYFTHWESDHPLFVEHATGLPRYRVVGGELESLGG